MPRVKIDYIVSFSSEDPENPASNLLSWDVNKKKWLCNKGEESCSVVLQLAQAVQICTIQVGAHMAALVEVLVGRSEKPNDPFQVLVPRCVFLAPAESRRAEGAAADRVRSFGAGALSAAAAQRWDRLRLVCSQPYNKHCKYGLSFVHVSAAESGAPAPAAPPALLALDAASSDEDEFRPGALFARHRAAAPPAPSADTGAQIRQASSQALKQLPEAGAALHKAGLAGAGAGRGAGGGGAGRGAAPDRRRDRLLYDADDDRPRDRVDRAVDAHNLKKDGEKGEQHKHKTTSEIANDNDKRNRPRPDDSDKRQRDPNESRDAGRDPTEKRRDATKPRKEPNDRRKDSDDRVPAEAPSGGGAARAPHDHARKRARDDMQGDREGGSGGALRAGPRSSAPHTLLRGAVIVLSGYQNPRRAALRDTALALGARVERDWGPRCTHLVCAFPNTPKLRAARGAPAARGEWLEAVARRRRALPWQWFATEPARRRAPPDGDSDRDHSECDTDDEIERVRQDLKRRRTADGPRAASPPTASPPAASPRAASPPTASPPAASPPAASPPAASPPARADASSEVVFVKDERLQGSVTLSDSESEPATEGEEAAEGAQEAAAGLPDLFAGRTFALAAGEPRARLLARYVRAYGGTLLEGPTAADAAADYVICSEGRAAAARGARVPPAWLWRCHAERRLCPLPS